MARTRRDILRERRDKQAEQKKKKPKKVQPADVNTSMGFMKGGLIGAFLGFAVGTAVKQRAFCTVAGFLTGGYIAENVKRMKEREQETNPEFVNYRKLKKNGVIE
jgi:uncharacterized protein YcfJ